MQYSLIRIDNSALNTQITQPPNCLYLYSKHRFDTSFPIITLWHTRKLTNTVKTHICGRITISPGGLCLPDTVYCITLIVLYSTVLYIDVIYCFIHYCNVLCYYVQYSTVLYITMIYCVIECNTVLCCLLQ